MFSKSCEYGIRATVYIACESLKNENEKVSLWDIAEAIDAPQAFTAKILQKLVKNHIIYSAKGPSGGFYFFKKDLDTLSIKTIISAIDGNSLFKNCILGLSQCSETSPCPAHFKLKKIKEDLNKTLNETYLRELTEKINLGIAYLKI